MDIPDINVWLALVDENHQHHAAALAYWHQGRADPVGFCRITMLGFMRLCTQPRVLSRTLTNPEAWDIYQRYLATPNLVFLAEPGNLEPHLLALTKDTGLPNRYWTDAYLAAFALAIPARLVSFDRDFQRFDGLDFLHLSVPLP
jgi:toxin-antitoxin system PIN domain toxin